MRRNEKQTMDRISLDIQRKQLDELARLIAERRQSEDSIRNSLQTRDDRTNTQFAEERDRLQRKAQAKQHQLEAQHAGALESITRKYESRVAKAAAAHDKANRATETQAGTGRQAAREVYETRRRTAEEKYKGAVAETAGALQEFKHKVEHHRDDLTNLDLAVEKILRRRWCLGAAQQFAEPSGDCNTAKPLERYSQDVLAARQARDMFSKQWVPKFVGGGWMVVIFVFTWIAAIMTGAALGLGGLPLIIATLAIALGVTLILYVSLRQTVVRQTLRQYAHFQRHLVSAGKALDAARTLTVAEADRKRILLRQEREQEIREAAATQERMDAEVNAQRDQALERAAELLAEQRQTSAEQRDRQRSKINQKFDGHRQELQQAYSEQQIALQERQQHDLSTSRESFQRSWDRLVRHWQQGIGDFQSSVDAMNEYCLERFPAWDQADPETWRVGGGELPTIRFGDYTVRLAMFEGGLPEFAELQPEETVYSLPAVVPFGQRAALLLESWEEGRAEANRCMQNVMLRLLTSLPPSKVCFTIIDPVGLGQDFSAFMHLADYDEKLVTHRIWTETGHINQRLADLTEHMEDVIQTYLRNEFSSIDAYNRDAGEVAEPFHILVVSNFPAGFSDEAAQRLLSITASGARCGVFSLISTDSQLELPRHFSLTDLEANACTVQWDGDHFLWLDEDVKDLPLVLDAPPTDQRLTEIIRTVGEQSVEAGRVEVPFSTVALPAQEWWTKDSRNGIDVALGRAGATKLQHLRLGQGTSQHVLISGKTGSGKSTLLHALIINTAVHYSPDEVEFYLIDFKKGVEFKPYAALQLPHARVVAIESEREFGMSVLQRLDLELRRRGDLFREQGVQGLRGFRDANPDIKLPRILLVIDEFQELFVQDDKLAQEAGLLLDRLVRQGRAFGIHVLLGSQTLAGAYSLARSTIGQMAVRIALQCSEADSHLILSEDNTAARLLNRPGEAIYNDANGLFEGNHPFQVVWLPADQQEEYLRGLADCVKSRQLDVEPAIVFEGNVPADVSQNAALQSALQDTEGTGVSPSAWLGAAVAIKEPTASVFRRQSGSNLLIVGQQEEIVASLVSNCLIGLAATSPARDGAAAARFYLFDGTRVGEPRPGDWNRWVDKSPLDIRMVTPQTTAQAMQEIMAEVSRRADSAHDEGSPVFVLVYNLARFRSLRRSDDDFGFSSLDDKPEEADKLFLKVLRDGPPLGVHTLVWCDTFNNVGRWLDRSALRDLDQRVLFQMSATDSSNLMDSPAASRLGTNRAVLYSEEQGQFEIFRPYGAPTEEWLDWAVSQLGDRAAPRAALTGEGE